MSDSLPVVKNQDISRPIQIPSFPSKISVLRYRYRAVSVQCEAEEQLSLPHAAHAPALLLPKSTPATSCSAGPLEDKGQTGDLRTPPLRPRPLGTPHASSPPGRRPSGSIQHRQVTTPESRVTRLPENRFGRKEALSTQRNEVELRAGGPRGGASASSQTAATNPATTRPPTRLPRALFPAPGGCPPRGEAG